MPLPTSNLRQVSTGAIKTGNNERAGSIDPSESSTTSSFPVKRVCSLSIHDDARNDVSVNLDHFPGENIKVGDLMQITASNDTANTSLDNDEPQSCNHGRNGQSSNNHDFTPSNVNARGSSQQWKHDYSEPASSLSQRYVFAVKNMSSEQKTKRPDCQVRWSKSPHRLCLNPTTFVGFCIQAHCRKIWPEEPEQDLIHFCEFNLKKTYGFWDR